MWLSIGIMFMKHSTNSKGKEKNCILYGNILKDSKKSLNTSSPAPLSETPNLLLLTFFSSTAAAAQLSLSPLSEEDPLSAFQVPTVFLFSFPYFLNNLLCG